MTEEVKRIAFESFRKGTYKKNIHYLFPGPVDPQEFVAVKRLAGSPGMSAWVIQKAHQKVGVQMQVAKSVSDDLIVSDFSEAATVASVPWPNPVVEVFFEDPLLPTILVMKATTDLLQGWILGIEVGLMADEYISACMQEGSAIHGSKQLSLQLKPDMYDDFLLRGETSAMDARGPLSSALTKEDNCAMSFMLNLTMKVFVFASIPRFKPSLISRKQMSRQGKPGTKGRPVVPAYRVVYAPKVIRDPSGFKQETGGRAFRGRRGHIHFYRHERFVQRKGTWDFLPPIPDPKTGEYPTRTIIRVRKP
jgi:hypothetical protein